MQKLTRDDLLSLEKYAVERHQFRAKVMAHKKDRQVALGPHLTLYFEDNLTIHYQIQEMLRAERIFEPTGIQDELDAYNPLIPDGNNWKAVMMIEYEDIEQRRYALTQMRGIEDRVWVQVTGHDKVFAIADEDLVRENDVKTSAVHFLRFELTDAMVAATKNGNELTMGVDHDYYREQTTISTAIQQALTRDLH